MKTTVFLGKRLPVDEAMALLDAVYLPAASTGDVLRALASGAETIALLDGSFETPVWHKEILVALSKGVRVLGACGIGALRAVELEPFGMIGIGAIFEAVRSGTITGDDELASGCDEDGAPLVDIQHALQHAASLGIIDPQEESVFVTAAQSIPPCKRTYDAVLTRAASTGIAHQSLSAFRRFLSRHRRLTQRDAEATLGQMREGTVPCAQPKFEIERTIALDRLASYADQLAADPYLQLPLELLSHPERGAHLEQVTRGGETLKVVRKKVLLRLLAAREMQRLGMVLTDEAVQNMATDFRRQFGLLTEADTREWMDSAGLSLDGFTRVMSDFAGIRILECLYAGAIDRDVAAHIRVNSVRDFVAGGSAPPMNTVGDGE